MLASYTSVLLNRRFIMAGVGNFDDGECRMLPHRHVPHAAAPAVVPAFSRFLATIVSLGFRNGFIPEIILQLLFKNVNSRLLNYLATTPCRP